MTGSEFRCVECKAETPIGGTAENPVRCEDCCPGHDYEYDRHERTHRCAHCHCEPPDDWYDDRGDC